MESVEEYCKRNEDKDGCEPHEGCCEAFNAECNACAEGMTVEEYCEINESTFLCGGEPCCFEDTAKCNACNELISVEEYCKRNEDKDDVKGCYATSLFVTLNM